MLKECESVKAKATVDWQTKEQMHDYFVHIIKELQGSDLVSQACIELNRPLHSNWANLLKIVSQLVIGKQPI